jgi:3-hydroxyisobutyrate dehydrogenase-like beta-hydroxyacid dehydrogenase
MRRSHDSLIHERGLDTMVTVGLVGAGAMGSALGANWIAGGADVVVCAADRSPRTQRLVAAAGLRSVPDLEDVVRADLVVSVVPPAEAVPAASMIMRAAKRAGVTPLVADLNAIAPSTLQSVQEVLGHAGLDLVDGSVSGPPPRANGIATRIYVSGPRSAELTGIASPWAEVIALPGNTGQASALKMCTASIYKGTNALIMEALLTASAHGVLDEFIADVSHVWPDHVPKWHLDVAMAATKSARFVAEMHEIALTQSAQGLPAALFEGVAAVYERSASTKLGRIPPEKMSPATSMEEVIAGLR